VIRLMLLGVLYLAAAGAQAQVYKCIDAAGKTSYSQLPCAANSRSAAVARTVPPAPAAAPAGASGASGDRAAKAAGPKTLAEQEQDFRKRRQEQEEAAKKEQEKLADARVREENCRSARQQVASLETGMRQQRVNGQGERYYLDEGQIEQEKATARKAAEQWCK